MSERSLNSYHEARSIDHQPFRSACYAPYVGLMFDIHGLVSVCAFTRSSPIGQVGRDRLLDMWNGPSITAIRQAVRSDDLDRFCSVCSEEIAGGNERGVFSLSFDQHPAREVPEWPSLMEFATSTTCNLQCVMCSGEFSSAIRTRREGLPAYPARYGDAFVEELRPFLPHLRIARFLGGEPFMAEINFRIWEEMIDVAATAECNVTTNGTQWTPRMEAVLEALPFSVGISIDGTTAATVESIRAGASFDRIMENVGRFVAYRDRHGSSLSFTFCLMVQNVHEFADYLRFAEDLGSRVYVNTVRQPPEYSLYRLPTEELRAVVARLERDRERVASALAVNRDVWIGQLDRLGEHLRHRDLADASFDDHLDGEPPAQFASLARAIAAADASEADVVQRLRRESVDGEVSILRCDAEAIVVEGDRYLDIGVESVIGLPLGHLHPMVSAIYGNQVDVLAQHVEHGASARVLVYRQPGGPPTVVATVGRAGPAPFAMTKYTSVVPSLRSDTTPTPVSLRATRRSL